MLRSLKCVAIAVEQAHCRSLNVNLCGKPHPSISKPICKLNDENYYRKRGRGTILREWFPVIWNQFCIEKSLWECESSPLSGIEKRPLLGGYVSIKVMLDTIRNTTVVRCREPVLFSEGPLSEARLYLLSETKYIVCVNLRQYKLKWPQSGSSSK